MSNSELIKKLLKYPGAAKVIVYAACSEDADFGGEVVFDPTPDKGSHTSEDRPVERPYVKGDWPDYGESGPVVIIC